MEESKQERWGSFNFFLLRALKTFLIWQVRLLEENMVNVGGASTHSGPNGWRLVFGAKPLSAVLQEKLCCHTRGLSPKQ